MQGLPHSWLAKQTVTCLHCQASEQILACVATLLTHADYTSTGVRTEATGALGGLLDMTICS